MNNNSYASLESQMKNGPSHVQDTDEMKQLRSSKDFSSLMKLGNLLTRQYRYREAIEAYNQAQKIDSTNKSLYISLGGAYLTVGQFDEAYASYQNAIKYGATEKTIAYFLGIYSYFKKEYEVASSWFLKCLPTDDEMAIAVIYWHTLSQARCTKQYSELSLVHNDMQVGHHTSYLMTMNVFQGTLSYEDAKISLDHEEDDLNAVILGYGLSVYRTSIGKLEEGNLLHQEVLKHTSIWPCISYLAAYQDLQTF